MLERHDRMKFCTSVFETSLEVLRNNLRDTNSNGSSRAWRNSHGNPRGFFKDSFVKLRQTAVRISTLAHSVLLLLVSQSRTRI